MARKKSEFLGSFGKAFQVFKALADEVLNLGGDDEDLRRIETNDSLRRKLAELIVGAKEVVAHVFKTWKTLKLGTGLETADDFRRSLKQSGCKIGDWANDILGKRAFAVATKETELDLVVVSVAELGFPNGATRQEIYQRAQQMGLELCPPEVGPQLRLQYKDQPMGEWLLIGMEPITDSGGYLGVFGVGRDGDDPWLSSYYGSPDRFWDDFYRWVFLRRK